MARQQLRNDIALVKQSFASALSSCEWDGDSNVDVEFSDGSTFIFLVDEYSKKNVQVVCDVGVCDTSEKSLLKAVAKYLPGTRKQPVDAAVSMTADTARPMDDDYAVLEDITSEEFEAAKLQLLADVEDIRRSSRRVGFYNKAAAHQYVVRLALDTSFLNQWMAAAWQVDNTKPIVFELVFHWRYTTSCEAPEAKSVCQTSDLSLDGASLVDRHHDFGVISWFIDNRLKSVLRHAWRNGGKSAHPVETPAVSSKALALQQMGFTARQAQSALLLASDDVDRAVALLADEPQLFAEEDSLQEEPHDASPPASKRPKHDESTASDDLLSSANFLDALQRKMQWILEHAPARCLICDEPLGYDGLKPAICYSDLCKHSMDAYGLGVNVAGELAHNAEIVDMLICMTSATCQQSSTSTRDVFSPFPDGLKVARRQPNGTLTEEGFLTAEGQKDIAKVLNVLNALPRLADLKSLKDNAELKKFLDARDPLCFPLLRWIISSNQAHLSPLPKEMHIASMQTDHQYVLCSSNPTRERAFRERRAEAALKRGGRGSFYAFHGSPLGNWHSILRMGLKNYSNTKWMTTGAAYGPGIYLAQNGAVSLGYMKSGTGWAKSMHGSMTMSCIALCEVIDVRNEPQSAIKCQNVHGGVYYIVSDESLVCTRLFFLYTSHATPSVGSVLADSLAIPENMF